MQTTTHRQTLCQSNITAKRTFKSWYYEYKKHCEYVREMTGVLLGAGVMCLTDLIYDLELEHAKMYYWGGYSPRMAFLEINRIPANTNII